MGLRFDTTFRGFFIEHFSSSAICYAIFPIICPCFVTCGLRPSFCASQVFLLSVIILVIHVRKVQPKATRITCRATCPKGNAFLLQNTTSCKSRSCIRGEYVNYHVVRLERHFMTYDCYLLLTSSLGEARCCCMFMHGQKRIEIKIRQHDNT